MYFITPDKEDSIPQMFTQLNEDATHSESAKKTQQTVNVQFSPQCLVAQIN